MGHCIGQPLFFSSGPQIAPQDTVVRVTCGTYSCTGACTTPTATTEVFPLHLVNVTVEGISDGCVTTAWYSRSSTSPMVTMGVNAFWTTIYGYSSLSAAATNGTYALFDFNTYNSATR